MCIFHMLILHFKFQNTSLFPRFCGEGYGELSLNIFLQVIIRLYVTYMWGIFNKDGPESLPLLIHNLALKILIYSIQEIDPISSLSDCVVVMCLAFIKKKKKVVCCGLVLNLGLKSIVTASLKITREQTYWWMRYA